MLHGAAHAAARRTPKQIFGKMSRRMAEVFFEGSALAMIGAMIRSEKLSPEDLEMLREIAEGESGARKNPKSARKKR